MEYIYTDYVQINKDSAMELFHVADRFAIDRLKTLCERVMLSAINTDTAAEILLHADYYNAMVSAIMLHWCTASNGGVVNNRIFVNVVWIIY